MASPTVARTA